MYSKVVVDVPEQAAAIGDLRAAIAAGSNDAERCMGRHPETSLSEMWRDSTRQMTLS